MLGRLQTCGAILLGGAALFALPAMAQDVVPPPAGTDIRLGNLRDQFARDFTPPAQRSNAPGWSTTQAISVEGVYADGQQGAGSGTGGGASIYGTVSPSLGVSGDSQFLSGSLFYAPLLRQYLTKPAQNSIAQNLNAAGRLTVVPELAFIDLRAATGIQSRSGGVGPNGSSTVSTQDQTQTTSLTVTPRLQHHFSDIGDGEIGYGFSKTTVSGNQPRVVSAFVAPQANQNLTTMSPYLTFRTGEAWGRFNGALNIQRSENSGQGVLSKSYQRTETVNGGYALDRIWTVTGSIGHEAIFYGGLNPVRINDITWSGGIQVTPSPDSQLMLSYGSKQGRPSLTFNAFTQITARTRLTASYSESLGTQAEDFQNSLATSGINSSGLSVSTLTGAPIGQSNNFNGAQGGVQRTKTASATVSWLRNLEAVSLTFSRVETAQVSNTVAGGPTSTSGINGSVAWQHTFSEVLSSNVFVQVGKRQSGGTIGIGNASQDTLTTYLGVNYIVSETITARMNYSYTSTTTSVAGQSGGQNQVLVGLTKTF